MGETLRPSAGHYSPPPSVWLVCRTRSISPLHHELEHWPRETRHQQSIYGDIVGRPALDRWLPRGRRELLRFSRSAQRANKRGAGSGRTVGAAAALFGWSHGPTTTAGFADAPTIF